MTQPSTTSRKPDFRLFNVLGTGETAKWVPIGAAWQHRDGNGFTLQCDAVPLHGRIVMRAPKEETAVEGGQQ